MQRGAVCVKEITEDNLWFCLLAISKHYVYLELQFKKYIFN